MLDKMTYLDGIETLARAVHEPDGYGRWLRAWNADQKRRGAYWESLRQLDPEIYRRAVLYLLPRIRRFPQIAEIIQAAMSVIEDDLELPTKEQAWQEVRAIANRINRGRHDDVLRCYVRYFHPDESDDEPAYTHPVIAHVMELMGGIETLAHGGMSYHKVRFDQLWHQACGAQLERLIRGQPLSVCSL